MCSDRNKKKPVTGQKKTYSTTDNFFGVKTTEVKSGVGPSA
jgi:hypothetical protein